MKQLRTMALIIAIGLIGIVGISIHQYSWTYMNRIIHLGESDTTDYKVFPSREIAPSEWPQSYSYELNPTFGQFKPLQKDPLDLLLTKSKTMSFLVIHKDKILYEYYGDGYNKTSINTSFSSVKSIDSLMIGIAIDKGFIHSEDDIISIYIKELKDKEIGNITIKQLLTMRSPIQYKEGPLWFGDDAKTYYMPNLRTLVLEETRIDPEYTGSFHYNNYHPLLLGMIIENSTGKSVSEFFEREIWKYDFT